MPKNFQYKKGLSLLSIEAAEEIDRLKSNKDSKLKSAKELSDLLKKEFTWRIDYQTLFSEAYELTYSESISQEESKIYINSISKKLNSPQSLGNPDLEKLSDFCVNLCDYASIKEDER